ncbi:hypothetical protein LPJ53_003862 [Coemansia erecta]|uniref:Uncharacterized protein n=1 Tax=Coemansia erecta TaxID=147472 RepID=A0A9W7XYD9_9FUNG|nr:hypothetical protein LPJ53_003862 [Coemansia erecta]
MMLGDSREALASPQFTQPQKQSLPKPRPQPQFHSNRYTVTMTQNLNRRFQTPLHHEYEQRIHCLHAHYTDVIERFEMQLQIQAANQHKYERSLCELRRANAVLQARESELRDRLQRKSSIGMPQKLVEIVDHYQQHMQNMSRETRTAQEWVIALAELVVGPKKETQSWDDWLNQSLEVLQKRHETQDKHTNALASPLQSPRC